MLTSTRNKTIAKKLPRKTPTIRLKNIKVLGRKLLGSKIIINTQPKGSKTSKIRAYQNYNTKRALIQKSKSVSKKSKLKKIYLNYQLIFNFRLIDI